MNVHEFEVAIQENKHIYSEEEYMNLFTEWVTIFDWFSQTHESKTKLFKVIFLFLIIKILFTGFKQPAIFNRAYKYCWSKNWCRKYSRVYSVDAITKEI